jgi:hypothetical protein
VNLPTPLVLSSSAVDMVVLLLSAAVLLLDAVFVSVLPDPQRVAIIAIVKTAGMRRFFFMIVFLRVVNE